MEKRRPHDDLVSVKAEVGRLGVAAFTKTALDGGRALGLTSDEMLMVVASLTAANFHKSMTSFSDHRVWQDVYHGTTPVRKEAYIKVTLHGAVPVIQFKEK